MNTTARATDDDEGERRSSSSLAVIAPLTDRVNVEPPILNGMTAQEAKTIGLAAAVFWLAVGGLFAWAVHIWQVVLAFGVMGPMVTVWMASTRLARIKRNRPDGYYQQAFDKWLVGKGLRQPTFISHDGFWEIGRRIDLSPVKRSRKTR